jgi:hypothetical protein
MNYAVFLHFCYLYLLFFEVLCLTLEIIIKDKFALHSKFQYVRSGLVPFCAGCAMWIWLSVHFLGVCFMTNLLMLPVGYAVLLGFIMLVCIKSLCVINTFNQCNIYVCFIVSISATGNRIGRLYTANRKSCHCAGLLQNSVLFTFSQPASLRSTLIVYFHILS